MAKKDYLAKLLAISSLNDPSALNHLGTNTMFYAAIWIAPEVDFAAVAVSNIGGEAGKKATDRAVYALVERYVLPAPADQAP